MTKQITKERAMQLLTNLGELEAALKAQDGSAIIFKNTGGFKELIAFFDQQQTETAITASSLEKIVEDFTERFVLGDEWFGYGENPSIIKNFIVGSCKEYAASKNKKIEELEAENERLTVRLDQLGDEMPL